MKNVSYFLPLVLLMAGSMSQAQPKESTGIKLIKTEENRSRQIFIDKFFIPKNSINEFIQRMDINRDFIKDLAGFLRDEVYARKDEEGNLILITIAVWKNQEFLDKAKASVQEEYRRTAFDPAAFMKRLNVQMDRGTYYEYGD